MPLWWCVPGLEPIVIATPSAADIADNWRMVLTGPVNVVSPLTKGTYDMIAPIPTRDISADIEAWRVELQRKRRSADYLSRGPRLIRELAERFGWGGSRDATTQDLATWLADSGGSSHSQNNRLSMISSYFEFCRRVRKSVLVNPADGLDRASGGESGDGSRAFTAAETVAIFGAAHGHWKTAVVMMALVGLRRGAVFRRLTCGMVDLDRRQLSVPGGVLKSKRRQDFPLNDEAFAVLAEAVRGRGASEFIVPSKFDQGVWLFLLKRAGVAHVDSRGRVAGTHSFRKHFATSLAMSGVHVQVAQQLLGHADVKQTLTHYTRLGTELQVAAVKNLPRLSREDSAICARSPEQNGGKVLDCLSDNGDAFSANRPDSQTMLTNFQHGQNERPDAGSRNGSHPSQSISVGRSFQSCSSDEIPVRGGRREVTPRGFEARSVSPLLGRADDPTVIRSGFDSQDPYAVRAGAARSAAGSPAVASPTGAWPQAASNETAMPPGCARSAAGVPGAEDERVESTGFQPVQAGSSPASLIGSSVAARRVGRGCPGPALDNAGVHESPAANSPESIVLDAVAAVPSHRRRALLLQLVALLSAVAGLAAVWFLFTPSHVEIADSPVVTGR